MISSQLKEQAMVNLESSLISSHTPEGVAVLPGVSWSQFETLAKVFQGRRIRLTYLQGILEIMSPISQEHESRKSSIGLLVETYFRAKGIRFYRTGGFTLKKPEYSSGEPDESYCLNTNKNTPDLLIEVIVSSGSINKLEIYKPFAVPEVWFWRKGKLRVFCFADGEYHESTASRLLPELDMNLLEACAAHVDQYEGIEAFQQALDKT